MRNIFQVGAFAFMLATTTSYASVQISGKTLTQIGSYANGVYVNISPAIPGLEGCSYMNGDELWIDLTGNPDGKAMYSTLLAAYLAGKAVGFGVAGCNANGIPLIYRVDVYP